MTPRPDAPRLRPFEPVPFDALPELPRVPHGWDAARGERVTVRSAHFGEPAIHHRVAGGGRPPLLLVHGLMTTSYSWRYVLAPLAEHFTVYAPDLPGCGRSDKPADRSFAPAHLATFLTEYQRAAGIAGCRAIGNSMGGYLCLRAALAHPGAPLVWLEHSSHFAHVDTPRAVLDATLPFLLAD